MDCNLPDSSAHGILQVACHFLLQGIFPTQGSNLHLLLGGQIFFFLPLSQLGMDRKQKLLQLITWKEGEITPILSVPGLSFLPP